ncbi:MAG TPA: hypothetical protein VM364_21375 [Vicinamibacterales bacterium]|nr:hypothetical protein [Vicinamibacterales bacterium]
MRKSARKAWLVAGACMLAASTTARSQYSGVWSESMAEGPPPTARNQVSSQYDQANDRLIVTGGNHYGWLNNDVWVLQNATQLGEASWQPLAPIGPQPPERQGHASGFDPVSNRLVIHGGWPGYADTWVLTNANGIGGVPQWIELPAAPLDRTNAAYGYDPRSNRLILFGGLDVNAYTIQHWHTDVWVLTDANGIGEPTWIELHPTGTPPPGRSYPAAAYDPASNRLIVHGGAGEHSLMNDLWVLSHANGLGGTPEWIRLSPTGVGPRPVASHHMAYDPAAKRALVLGGWTGAYPYSSEVWVLDHADATTGTPTWHALSVSGPDYGGNVGAAFGWSTQSQRFIYALGAVGIGYRNDVWLLALDLGPPPDTEAPDVDCAPAPSGWIPVNVEIPCTASDGGSGLADPAAAAFVLMTAVAAGTETSAAATTTRLICDRSGNCAMAGPFGGISVDRKPPSISITSPAESRYLLNTSVVAAYSCHDGGSGLESCTGTTPPGSQLPASTAGVRSFVVHARDNVGNTTTQSFSYAVTYVAKPLYDVAKPHKSGSTVPIRLMLTDAAGTNVSSAEIVVTAVRVQHAATGASFPIAYPNGSPGATFRFDPSEPAGGAYIFTLSLKNYAAGTYLLAFVAGEDPIEHTVSLVVR